MPRLASRVSHLIAFGTVLMVLTSAAAAQAVSVIPSSLSWGSVQVGQTSGPKSVTLTNNQSAALTISSIAVVDSDFIETASTCPLSPSTLAPGASCAVSLSFRPLTPGNISGSLTFTDDGAGSPQTVTLSGTGTAGALSFSPPSLTFPSTADGAVSPPQTATLTNATSSAVTLTSISHFGQFAETDNCPISPSTLAAGAKCTVSVTFNPTSSGTLTGGVVANYASTSTTLFLTGTGPPLTITPRGGLSFSTQIVGRTSSPQTITVTNSTDAAITMNAIASSGSDFVQTNNCIGTLAGHASCTINVSFSPQAANFRNGSITASYNGLGSPLPIPVNGKGIVGDTGVSVFVTPFTSCALPSQTLQFIAQVTNTANTGVNWYVDNVLNGNSDVGTISTGGLYTAPVSQSTHTIKAISQADGTASGLGTITVSSRPSYGINPFTASVLVSTDQPFQAQICYVPDNNVTFSVDNIPGGNSVVGTVSSTGIYTAPASPGRHTVRALDTSLNRSSGAVVTVYSKMAVDFGARSNTIYPLPPDVFGVNHADDLHTAADIARISGAISTSRTYAQIPLVYATETPDWTKIDPRIASLRAAGIHPMLQMAYTPPFLQPSPNPCGPGNVSVPPTDFNRWGQIAASYVAHMDAAFPGWVRDYEIWNEPNTPALCGQDMNTYFQIYAAAAPLMKQASTNPAGIRIGGPAVAGLASPWITGLLTNPSTAPYVDFVSYHQYLYGGTNREAKWDTFNGTKSVYQRMQEPGDGVAAYFIRANGLLQAGNQPLGAKTPLFLNEYNVNYTFLANCCGDDPTFSPVYNGLFVADLLNTVYNGSQEAPGGLSYFAANNYPYFCLIGTRNNFMDCQYSIGSTPEPYPQYYLYQLLSSPTYLGLKDGAFLAPAITPSLLGGGLGVSAFYTTSQDAIFIVNPTPTNYQQVPIEAQNTGLTPTQATLYQIVNGQTISQSPLPLTTATGETTYTATINVPAYSVLAIGIQGTPDQNPRSVRAIVSASPEPSLYQAPFAVSATISALNGTATPTGTVTFSVDGTAIGPAPLINGTATASESTVVFAGSHIIAAAYSGDSNFDAATFSGTHIVASIATSTTLQSAPNPAMAGQPVVFTATVTAGGTPPPGPVTFADGATELGTATLDTSGVATFTTSTLAVGSHTVSATYTGQAQYGASSNFVVEEITTASLQPTTTTLTSALNPSQLGQSVTFTATVTGSGGVPTGQVSFSDGATQLGSAALDASGIATLTTSALTVGSHAITANYTGDTQFLASSSSLNQVISNATTIAPTTTALVSSLNPAQVGQSITFTATVASSGGVVTGTVNFLDGGALLAQSSLDAQGNATYNTSALPAGTHTITAAYQGSPLFAQSTSSPVGEVVQVPIPGDFAITITPTRLSVVRGGVATYSVALGPVNGFSGIVNFTCGVGGAKLTTCSLDPASLTGGGGTTLSVLTGAAHPTTSRNRTPQTTLVVAGLFCCMFIRRKKLQSTVLLLILAFAAVTGMTGCGSNGTLGTPPGTYIITVTGTSTSTGTTITHTASAKLNIS